MLLQSNSFVVRVLLLAKQLRPPRRAIRLRLLLHPAFIAVLLDLVCDYLGPAPATIGTVRVPQKLQEILRIIEHGFWIVGEERGVQSEQRALCCWMLNIKIKVVCGLYASDRAARAM